MLGVKIKSMDYRDLEAGHLAEIDAASLTGAASSYTGGTSSASGSSTSVNSVRIEYTRPSRAMSSATAGWRHWASISCVRSKPTWATADPSRSCKVAYEIRDPHAAIHGGGLEGPQRAIPEGLHHT